MRLISTNHLPNLPFTILRTEYLLVTSNYCAAKLLALFEAWSCSRPEAWLSNSLENLQKRLLHEYSLKTIGQGIQKLVQLGFLKARFDPNNKWCRKKQYQFQAQTLQAAIDRLAPEQFESDYPVKAETQPCQETTPRETQDPAPSKEQTENLDRENLLDRHSSIADSGLKKDLKGHKNSQTNSKTASCVSVQLSENENSNSVEPSPSQGEALRPKAPATAFERWYKGLEDWQEFLRWKAEQAPTSVRDCFAWAFNVLRANLDRAELSLLSFRQERSQASRNARSDNRDFAAWEWQRHEELAREYVSNTVAFLRSEAWHKEWIDFVNAQCPELFQSVA